MPSPDLVLLHPPTVYDFRRRTILYGPTSDLVPPSPIFEMYPIGFSSIAEYLEHAGYRVRIINLAVRMLQNKNFNVERAIERLNPLVFGIDLHWLPHAHGAIEIARIVKKYHPSTPIIMGGISASYYYQELLQYPEVDYVLRGDSTEEPLRQLMDCIVKGAEPEGVPNLLWRDSQGNVRENPFSHVPTELDTVMLHHYQRIPRDVIRYRDLASYIPFKGWLQYPITAALTCRGCTQNCVTCGGSAYAFRHICKRESPAFRPPGIVIDEIRDITRFSKGPVFILGDIRQPGEEYTYNLLKLLKREKIKNQVIMELFNPAPADLLQRMGESCPHFCLEFSPESHSPEVRRADGKHYSNEELERTLEYALSAGCGRLDVFFMIGLPQQTHSSVMETIEYCGSLMERFKGDRRLSLFISPLAPFLDPGSLGFEQPERHGYHIFCHTLEEHRRALLLPTWKHTLNYETEWMDRDQIAATTYEAGLRLNHLKAKYGLIPQGVSRAVEQRIEGAQELLHKIDDIVDHEGSDADFLALSLLKAAVDEASMSTVCEKRELELSVGYLKLRPLHLLWSWLKPH